MAEDRSAAHPFSAVADPQPLRDRRFLRSWKRIVPWPEIAFLAVFGFYIDRCVNMRLVFWNQNDLFLWNFRFARDFLMASGQPSRWLGKLLLQLCHLGWPGALAVAAMACLVLFSARAIFVRIAPVTLLYPTWIVTAILLVVLHSQYGYSLTTTVALTLVLIGAGIYMYATCRGERDRLAIFVLESIVLYYLAGEAYWTFAGCCLVYEWLIAGRRRLALALLSAAAAVTFGIDGGLSYLNAAGLNIELPETSYLMQGEWDAWLRSILYAYFPACLLLLVAVRRHREVLSCQRPPAKAFLATDSTPSEPDAVKVAAAAGSWGDPPPSDERSCPRWIARLLDIAPRTAAWVLLVIAAVAGVELSPAHVTRTILEIDFASNNQQWETVLTAASGLPPTLYADYANQDVIQALYHLGRLPDEMFSYPQWRLFCEHGFGARGRLFSRKACDLFLQLGRVNEAEVIAHNDFERHPSAVILMRIARTKIIKGETEAARLYLNVLRDDLCYGSWAEGCLRRLREGQELCEPELGEVRSRMITQDDVSRTQVKLPDGSWSISTEQSLLSLLDRNPRNRMAFEYLMAVHLLRRDHAAVVRELTRLKAFSYPKTPLSYEEATLLHAGNQREMPQMTSSGALVNGCPIRRETVTRFLHLFAIDNTYHGFANPAARNAVLRDLGNSYFAYVFCEGGQDDE